MTKLKNNYNTNVILLKFLFIISYTMPLDNEKQYTMESTEEIIKAWDKLFKEHTENTLEQESRKKEIHVNIENILKKIDNYIMELNDNPQDIISAYLFKIRNLYF